MTLIVGLTGGIGSGKTTVARQFERLGIPVYIADEEARKLMKDPAVVSKISEALGGGVIDNGQIAAPKLAALVFSNPEKLALLNSLVHPLVARHFSEWVKRQQSSYVIKEAAILFESGSYKQCDKIITVTAPVEVRIERVMSRDKSSREEVESRMANQWPDEKKIALSDYVIENISIETTQAQIDKIHKDLLNI